MLILKWSSLNFHVNARYPRRYEAGSADPEFPSSVVDYYRRIHYQALDLITSSIRSRFEQPGYQTYRHLQDLLLKAAQNTEYQSDLKFVTEFYGTDLFAGILEAQLQVFSSKFVGDGDRDVIEKLKLLTHEEKELLLQVVILAKLMLVVPATNAVSERSLCWVKTYLRSTMNQDRLNHLMILNVYKILTD